MGFLKSMWMRIEKAYNTADQKSAPPGVTPDEKDDRGLLNNTHDPNAEDHEYWRSDTR